MVKIKVEDILLSMWYFARDLNNDNIFKLLEKNHYAKFLDLGCDTGEFTLKVANKVGTIDIYGVDITDELRRAKNNGVKALRIDVNKNFPFVDNSFDIIHANQIIEHLIDTDNFAKEIYRILKPGGYAIISTENLSSWHNIFALILGRQAFSQHISAKCYVGNDISPHHKEEISRSSWVHNRIFTYFGLKEFFILHKFKPEKLVGAGYYPFIGKISKIFSIIDPVHAHFITIKIRK